MRLPLHLIVICVVVLCASVGAQTKKDVFIKKQPEVKPDYQMGIMLEYFQLDHRTANKLLRKYAPMASDAHELRAELDALIDKEQAELLETAWVIARSGNRAKTESVKEYIYPTEYDPPQIPNNVGDINITTPDGEQQTSNAKILFAEPIPSDHEFRNVGVTLEVDPVLGSNNSTVDLNLSPELVTLLKNEYHVREGHEDKACGTTNLKMPIFYTMKTTTQVVVTAGKENLFGFHTPSELPSQRILVMLKVDLIQIPASLNAQ